MKEPDSGASILPDELHRPSTSRDDGPEITPIRDADEAPRTELDLAREWLRQARVNATIYAKALGMSVVEYIDGLPRIAPQPSAYIGRFDTPVIVQVPVPEKGLTVEKMLQLVGIYDWDNFAEVSQDWPYDPQGFRTPSAPYTTWLNDGTAFPGQRPTAVRKMLAPDARGGTVHDGLGLFISDHNILTKYSLDLPGSQLDDVYIPSLAIGRGIPRLHFHVAKYGYPGYNSVVAGRQIEVGQRSEGTPRPL